MQVSFVRSGDNKFASANSINLFVENEMFFFQVNEIRNAKFDLLKLEYLF